jgi:lysozyme
MDFAKQLEEFEGREESVYKDPEGWWTIGVGVLVDGRKGGGLREEEIDFIRDNRIRLVKEMVLEAFPWAVSLNEPRQAVLFGMAYQLGLAGLKGFVGTLRAVQDEHFADAAQHMLNSTWAGQTPERVRRLALQMSSGEWQ